LERDIEDGGVFVFWVYAGEMVWCEAAVYVLAELFGCEAIRFELVHVIYCPM
jgi:hypothetical protein